MAINVKRSQFLASRDRKLRKLYDAGFSWLTYAIPADAASLLAKYRVTYDRAEIGPEFDSNGDLLPHRVGVWVKHPPVALAVDVGPPPPTGLPPDPEP